MLMCIDWCCLLLSACTMKVGSARLMSTTICSHVSLSHQLLYMTEPTRSPAARSSIRSALSRPGCLEGFHSMMTPPTLPATLAAHRALLQPLGSRNEPGKYDDRPPSSHVLSRGKVQIDLDAVEKGSPLYGNKLDSVCSGRMRGERGGGGGGLGEMRTRTFSTLM